MNLFKKLFGKKLDNTILLSLLDNYSKQPSDKNYQAVLTELLNGQCYLLTPTVNDGTETGEWTTLQKTSTIRLNGIFNLDGLKVLGAFTDEKALLAWAKKPTQYTAMGTDAMFDICKNLGIGRVVINSDQPNMFVLQRNLENVTSMTIEEETKVQIGTPAKPLPKDILDKIIANFKQVNTIEEAYQYLQVMNNESSIVLGIKLSIISENSHLAVQNAVTNAIENKKLDLPLDVMILQTDDWLNTVRNIKDALFYKK